MQSRVQKLLIMVGEESVQMEGRDFRKLVDVLVHQYLKGDSGQYKKLMQHLFPLVVKSVPLKAHFYAGITAETARVDSQFAGNLLDTCGGQLQKNLSEGNYVASLNLLNYFAQAMNISFLNSLTFMNLLEDILSVGEKQQNIQTKRAALSILIQGLPLYAASLHEKTSHQFKKFIDKLKKLSEGDLLCQFIHQQFIKDKLINYSVASRLNGDFSTIAQHGSKLRVTIQLGSPTYFPVDFDNSKLQKSSNKGQFQIFKRQYGLITRGFIESVIDTFSGDKTILSLKILNIVKWKGEGIELKNIIDYLLYKILRSKKIIVQASLIIAIKTSIQSSAKIITQCLMEMIEKGEAFQLTHIFSFCYGFSFIVNNWGQAFDWTIFSWASTNNFVKRKLILQLILQRIAFTNDKFVCPENLTIFDSPKPMLVQQQYGQQEEKIFDAFQNLLKQKADFNTVISEITSQRKYEIFLQAFFRRTSLSQKHLQVLQQRYHNVLVKFAQWDWDLINKIRNFFRNSFFHRLFYLKFMISKDVLKFASYVGYVGNLKDKTQIQMGWIKMEIHELNLQFGKSLKATK